MDLGIQDKVAVVTGGSRGLGRMAAVSLAVEGVRVAICGRRRQTLDSTVEELRRLGTSAVGIEADITKPESARWVHDQTVLQLGSVDILVNNVGGRRGSTIMESSEEQLKAGFEQNLWHAVRFMQLVLPNMKEQCWGRIINVSSIFGKEYGGALDYMAAKAALIATTKHMAIDLARYGVLVNCVAPGSILHEGSTWERFCRENPSEIVSAFIERNLPMGRFGWPEPIGDTIAFLASERASLITGACINVDGGQSRSLI